jgi:hypothetical protein
MVVETRPDVVDAADRMPPFEERQKQQTTAIAERSPTHPWVYAIVFAEGDLALVAETQNVHPNEITKFAIEHAEEITTAMYSAFKGKLIKEMSERLPDLTERGLLQLFDIVKGTPDFGSIEVEGGGDGKGGMPTFSIKMGVNKRGTDD